MNSKDLTRNQVIRELDSIIRAHPERLGSINPDTQDGYDEADPDDLQCVYYLDQDGKAVNNSDIPVGEDIPVQELVCPVCIIGQWIEDFHPEFKEDDVIKRILFKNSNISSLRYEPNQDLVPFTPEVWTVLADAQNVQDNNKPWGDIVLPEPSF